MHERVAPGGGSYDGGQVGGSRISIRTVPDEWMPQGCLALVCTPCRALSDIPSEHAAAIMGGATGLPAHMVRTKLSNYPDAQAMQRAMLAKWRMPGGG